MEESNMTAIQAAQAFPLWLRGLRACGITLVLAALLGACEDPEQDKFRYEGGASPDPSGIIDGTVAYVGPGPQCEYSGGKPTRIIGRVLLTLFVYDNPAPPDGRATSATNLLAINGDKLFTLNDCVADGKKPDLSVHLTRSVNFHWVGIPLAETEVSYQIRGFFDYDEDMIPFFSVTRLPTQGDIAGGAVRDISDPSQGFEPITMPSRTASPKGFVRGNVVVGLNQYIWTERPAFELNANRALDAEQAVPIAVNLSGPFGPAADPTKTLQQTWALTCASGATNADGTFKDDCGFAVNLLDLKKDGPKLESAGVGIQDDDSKYAIYPVPVNVRTIHQAAEGQPPVIDEVLPDYDANGAVPDRHPVLGSTTSLGIYWHQPLVIMQRTPFVLDYDKNPDAQTTLEELRKLEAAARIPGVALVGAPLPSEIGDLQADPPVEGIKAFTDHVNIAVPPVAVVDLDPLLVTDASKNGLCRIPYIPFGDDNEPGSIVAPKRTTTRSYEARLTDCQDMPTGVFGVNVFAGIAGGQLRKATAGEESENGLVADGNYIFSGQSWSVPNELGNDAQVNSDGKHAGDVIPSQGWDRLFIVHDPNPEPTDECTTGETLDPDMPGTTRPIKLRQVCKAGEYPLIEDPGLGPDRVGGGTDAPGCLPDDCCDAVSHLCGVPLCPVIQLAKAEGLHKAAQNADAWNVRGSPDPDPKKSPTIEVKETVIINGKPVTRTDVRTKPNCIPFALPTQCCK
jgi:hypothetical protein